MTHATRPHAVMFHHFHGPGYPKSQGSISADQLERIIEHYGGRLMPASVWRLLAIGGALDDHVCLSFDDGLRCQYDIALPVLEKHGLTAFWFVYTSVFEGKIEMMEVYRKFRMECFVSVDDFYANFLAEAMTLMGHKEFGKMLESFDPTQWDDFPFYTEADRRFRFLRDTVLGLDNYAFIMTTLMALHKIPDATSYASGLWLDKLSLQQLTTRGHVIGLHSHTHPMNMRDLSLVEQVTEYGQNYQALLAITGARPTSMSYPCNSYNDDIAGLAQGLGIEIGFRANMAEGFTGPYEYPREDCANLIRRLEPCQV